MIRYFFQKQEFDTDMDYIFWVLYSVLIILMGFTVIFFHLIPPYLREILFSCTFHKVTGLYCPGCGGTRATEAFFSGHFIKSFLLHPIPVYVGFLGSLFLFGRTLARITKGRINRFHAHIAFLWVALALIVINCFIKNFYLLYFHIRLLA